MPSLQTLVADLRNRSVVGIGKRPPEGRPCFDDVISGTCRIKHMYANMNAALSGSNRLDCLEAGQSPDFNGTYIFNERDFTDIRVFAPAGPCGDSTYGVWAVAPTA